MSTLDIEWRHLDQAGNTCVRCTDTGEALQAVVARLADECAPCDWQIRYTETKLGAADIAQSNLILFNGRPIESVLPGARADKSHCPSCCAFTGDADTDCRTVEFAGQVHEAIPASLIRQAVCEIAQCC